MGIIWGYGWKGAKRARLEETCLTRQIRVEEKRDAGASIGDFGYVSKQWLVWTTEGIRWKLNEPR